MLHLENTTNKDLMYFWTLDVWHGVTNFRGMDWSVWRGSSEKWTDFFGSRGERTDMVFFPHGLHDMEDRETESVCLNSESADCWYGFGVWLAGVSLDWPNATSQSHSKEQCNTVPNALWERETEKKMNVSVIIIHGVTDNNRCFIEMLSWLFRCLTGHCENISPDTGSEIMW